MLEAKPSVLILMATYQGERFVEEQIESFAAQQHQCWALLIADDGSDDRTLERIRAAMAMPALRTHHWSLLKGPRQGAAANFMFLLSEANRRIAAGESDAQYIALADQDDVWLPTKLSSALSDMHQIDRSRAALWCSAVHFWNGQASRHSQSRSLSPGKPLGFGNALVQNMIRGNTLMLNRAALDLLTQTETNLPLVMHDWWCYLLMSACGARIFYSDQPSVLYRQHPGNVIGAASGWSDRAKRLSFMLRGGFANWNRVHLMRLNEVMRRHPSVFGPEAVEQFLIFERMLHAQSAIERLQLLKRGGFYRQTRAENLSLRAALVLGKF
ncbi:MAG: glycosyltransferase [Betaproteobacteria bacterium]|nr:glycosyltransferase [Betaproteobacteria bacterium]HAB47927.1 hypothetical protein [Lautropia sp.]NCV15493.1 glycosyltransferase [Betaproteobacteria bacterium]NCY08158.1 glycosyltransferase [Betaproteobacteria bacterium]NDC03905.1 glycosyltransferase [Betaproteobacteria bacterium]